jgi:hypothetical protein
MKIASDKRWEIQYMSVGMSKRVYKEMVNDIDYFRHEMRTEIQ